MPRPPIETGRPWIAFVVALAALGGAVWLFANADEAALDRPTVAERLSELADEFDGDEVLVVPTSLPPEWSEPGLETATDGDRLVRFELRVVRRYEDPDREGSFVAVRVHVCTAADPTPCLRGRMELTRTTTDGITTVITVDDEQFLDDVTTAWADVDVTSDWRAVDWTTRLR